MGDREVCHRVRMYCICVARDKVMWVVEDVTRGWGLTFTAAVHLYGIEGKSLLYRHRLWMGREWGAVVEGRPRLDLEHGDAGHGTGGSLLKGTESAGKGTLA